MTTQQFNSNFPKGFKNGVSIQNMPILNSYSHKVFWVDSVHGSDQNKGTFDRPFATLNGALTNSAVGLYAGDTIMLKSGHAETLVAANAVNCNIADINIIGLGTGENRPTFTFTPLAVGTNNWLINAAGVYISNIIGVTGLNAITNPFKVQTADCTLDIEWRDASNTKEAATVILTTAGASRLNVNLVYKGFTNGSSAVAPIKLNGVNGARINLDFNGIVSVAVVNFITAACSDVAITGYAYVQGDTTGALLAVDTITGSKWFIDIDAGAVGMTIKAGSGLAVAPAGVIGFKTDASVYLPGTTATEMAYTKGQVDLQEKTVICATSPKVIVNGDTLFTVAGGPIQILELVSICNTANNATASTLQYSSTQTLGGVSQTISGASASLASATAGTTVMMQGTALATAPLVNANGANITGQPGNIVVFPGTITAVVGVGSTTGTWTHYIRYKPLATGVTVS